MVLILDGLLLLLFLLLLLLIPQCNYKYIGTINKINSYTHIVIISIDIIIFYISDYISDNSKKESVNQFGCALYLRVEELV